MVHILLLVLKIIGIVLLILLAALLLAVAALLFVPVRYRGRLQKPEDGWRRFAAAGKISWLFRTVALDAVYENGSFFGCVRLFGLPVRRFGGRREESGGQGKTPGHGKEDETAERGAGEKVGKTPGKAVEESVTSEASYEPLEAAEDRIAKEPQSSETDDGAKLQNSVTEDESFKDPEVSEPAAASSGQLPWEKAVGLLQWLANKIAGFFRGLFYGIGRILGLPRRAAQAAGRLKKRLQRLKKSLKDWKQFLASEPFREGMKLLLGEARRVLGQLLPRKVKGNVTFGFDDPALTGQTLGLVSLFGPALTGEFRVVPVFEQEILRMDISAAGRIYGITLVQAFWRLFRDRNIRILYRKFR